MKITAVETTVTERPVPHRFRWRAGLPGSRETNVTTQFAIRTDEGVESNAVRPH